MSFICILRFPLRKNSHIMNRCLSECSNFVSQLALSSGHLFGNKPALIVHDETLTFAQLGLLTARYAACLHQLGLTRKDRLMAKVSKRPENVALYLATLRLGAIYVPINPAYTRAEMGHFVGDCLPKIIVTDDSTKDRGLETETSTLIGENKLAKLAKATPPMFDVESVRSRDVACVCYTSGTTGRPKGAMLTHGNLTSNAGMLQEAWCFSQKDTLLHALPIYHIHGLFVALNMTLLTGASTVFRPRFNVDDILKWMPKCSAMMGVPTYYSRLLASSQFTKEITNNMRVFISGSAPLALSTWQQFKERTGHKILERYGMTEGLVVTTNPYNPDERIPGTVGKPLPGIEVHIGDGILQYRGPNTFKGYWGQPEKTRQEFTGDGFFISGDLADIDENGYVRILGRAKDMIISGGLNIYPKEIEDALNVLSGIEESAVIGVPHSDLGEIVIAICIPSSDSSQNSKQLLESARNILAGYKVPKRLIFVDNLPRNFLGKVQKNTLKQSYKSLLV